MANPLQGWGWISRTWRRAESSGLALAVVLWLGLFAIRSAEAQTFALLYTFTGAPDGGVPEGGLFRDTAGTLYGTTLTGGSSDVPWGTVFKLDMSGRETVLHSFTGWPTDGGYPEGSLVRDGAGNFYGTTYYGGSGCYGTGCGAVFKVDDSGTETVLYSFAGGWTDGCNPQAGLVRDKAGNLYGTTLGCGSSAVGTVFKLSKSGKEAVLHNFTGTSDGGEPDAGLVMDPKGNLYGVTEIGGASNEGVVYKLNKNSGALTVLHDFAGGTTDGCNPRGTPIMDENGNLYGTSEKCGSSNHGVVWKLSKSGKETVLHSFAGGSPDGALSIAGVVRDAKGNLYGVTNSGGASNYGTVYKLNQKGDLTLLHSFTGQDGEYPNANLIRDAKDDLFGTVSGGGSNGEDCNVIGCGTLFRVAP